MRPSVVCLLLYGLAKKDDKDELSQPPVGAWLLMFGPASTADSIDPNLMKHSILSCATRGSVEGHTVLYDTLVIPCFDTCRTLPCRT